MFGRFNEVEDKPDWREKLAEWRDSPLFVFERPSWIREPVEVILLTFATLLLLAIGGFYVACSPPALPKVLPGHVTIYHPPVVAAASPAVTAAFFKSIADNPDATAEFWAAVDQATAPPPRYPNRRTSYAFIAFALACAAGFGAWRLSSIRAARHL